MSSHEFLSEHRPNPGELQKFVTTLVGYKVISFGGAFRNFVLGEDAPNLYDKFPPLRGETLAAGDILASREEIKRRIGRAGVLLGDTPDPAILGRAYRQLAGVEGVVDEIDPLQLQVTFNDMNECIAQLDFLQGVQNVYDPLDVDTQLALENQIFAGARLAAEQYVIASIEES